MWGQSKVLLRGNDLCVELHFDGWAADVNECARAVPDEPHRRIRIVWFDWTVWRPEFN